MKSLGEDRNGIQPLDIYLDKDSFRKKDGTFLLIVKNRRRNGFDRRRR